MIVASHDLLHLVFARAESGRYMTLRDDVVFLIFLYQLGSQLLTTSDGCEVLFGVGVY